MAPEPDRSMLDLKKVFGSTNDRKVKGLLTRVAKVNALEPAFERLSDEQLRAKTTEFREKVAAGATLDSLLN